MKIATLVHQFRVFLVTLLAGLAFAALAMLVLHYGLSASSVSAENRELKEQVKTLVERQADVEAALRQVNEQRKELDEMTLAAVNSVLGTTTLNPEVEGRVYLATLSAEQRAGGAAMPVATQPQIGQPKGGPAAAPALGMTDGNAFMGALANLAAVRAQAADLLRTMRTTGSAVALRQEVLAAIPSRLPAKGWISSGFGVRVSPFHGTEERMHNGIDIAADTGTPVYATADGVVTYAGTYGGFGNYVRVCHGFGICTRYAHNAEIMVKKGQKVKRGDQLAVIGVTGRTTGPHVHYEVLIHDQPVDPARFFFEAKPESAPPAGPSVAFVGPLPVGLGQRPAPMGGELEREYSPGLATGKDDGLTARIMELTAEPLVFAAALPAPLRQTTTSDVMLIALVLVMLTVASSLVRVPEGSSSIPRRPFRLPRPPANARRFDWGLWAGQDEKDEGEV